MELEEGGEGLCGRGDGLLYNLFEANKKVEYSLLYSARINFFTLFLQYGWMSRLCYRVSVEACKLCWILMERCDSMRSTLAIGLIGKKMELATLYVVP